jgi:hypothetical protein
MSDPMTSETANVIVVVRMADDLHHLLGRVTAACFWVVAFFAIGLAVDLFNRDWIAALFMAMGVAGFGLMGRDTWTRRRKYATFARTVTR